jgi:hypothetical protein
MEAQKMLYIHNSRLINFETKMDTKIEFLSFSFFIISLFKEQMRIPFNCIKFKVHTLVLMILLKSSWKWKYFVFSLFLSVVLHFLFMEEKKKFCWCSFLIERFNERFNKILHVKEHLEKIYFLKNELKRLLRWITLINEANTAAPSSITIKHRNLCALSLLEHWKHAFNWYKIDAACFLNNIQELEATTGIAWYFMILIAPN